MIFLFFGGCSRALNSEGVRFSGGSRTLEKFWHEVNAVSSSLALINKGMSYPHYINPHVLCRGIIAQKAIKIQGIQLIQA